MSNAGHINEMNRALAARGQYAPNVEQSISKWADIRNRADHGQVEMFTLQDIQEMYDGINSFIQHYAPLEGQLPSDGMTG